MLLNITFTAATSDEVAELHSMLEGMMEVRRDDDEPYGAFNRAIDLIQEPNVDYTLDHEIGYAVMMAIENIQEQED